eukprot:TRINITY_DN33461_c0_g1_i1.p1 TRINITY_DN33461_c0_g1~~TRINITY_DN33461_c0_g1_i1.p1  ORF type:complete len:272 (-),score=11.75 TRINITY_DN33461_c0_g1_i1:279-1094(-)
MERRFGIHLVKRRQEEDALVKTHTDEVWELLTNTFQLGPYAPLVSSQVVGVPGAILVPGLLRASECQALVCMMQQIGFTNGESMARMTHRDPDACVLVVPQEMGSELGRRIGPFIPRTGAGGNRRCTEDFINICFRCYRYRGPSGASGNPDKAQFVGRHYDGKQHPVAIIDGCLIANNECSVRESQMSLLLYLTDGHTGGETIFHPKGITGDIGPPVHVAPLVGAGLCFWHGDHLLSQLHEGTALTHVAGTGDVAPKYVIRTDVFFDHDET